MAKRELDVHAPVMPMEGEPTSAYGAFCVYANLGIGRKLTQVVEILGEAPNGGLNYTTVLEWSKRYDWDRRIIEFESSRQRALAAEESAARKKSLAVIEREKLRRIGDRLRTVDALMARGLEMLSYDLHEMVEEEKPVLQPDGKTLIVRKIYMPTKWSQKDAASLIKTAMDLEKNTLFEEDAKVKVEEAHTAAATTGLAAWQVEQAERIRSLSIAPPPLEPAPEPEEADDSDAA